MSKIAKQQKKVVLSPIYMFPTAEDVIDFDHPRSNELDELDQIKGKQLFFLSRNGESFYLINPTIKAFLQSFKEPKSLEEVTFEFAKKSNCEPKQIEEVMANFFKKMYKKGILINLDDAEIIQTILTTEFLEEAKFEEGDYILDYKIVSILSIRNATQLYICKHPDQEENVVIKMVIHPEVLPQQVKERSLNKFRQEFGFMQKLGYHPNVCNLVELRDDWDHPFAAIEHIEGKSLRAYISDNKKTPIKTKLSFIRQVLESIAHVQKHNILHGDIHLSNFLINKKKQVKLIDFGMSNHDLPEENEIIRNGGVYECIPPERIKVSAFGFLSQRADYQSEVFQLGVIIYYILYGKYPFTGFTWKKLAKEIQEKNLEYPLETNNNKPIPNYIITLLTKALKKDPKQRFKNAQEMLDFIDNNS